MSERLHVVVGPTGAGKTRAAVAFARRIGGVVLSADARQVYRGFDVATGKEGIPGRVWIPGLGDVHARTMEGVAQVGIDLASPEETWTAARWVDWARAALDALFRAGTPVVVAGGTGLYVEALLRGFQFPRTVPEIRAAVAAHLSMRGRDRQRAIRRAELLLLADEPTAQPPGWQTTVVTIDPPRDLLRQAIERRVRSWFETGRLLEEAARLRADVPSGLRAWSAIGYREALEVLDGRCTTTEAIANCLRRTWEYSRRQRTFFRHHLPEAAWTSGPEAAMDLLSAQGPLLLKGRRKGD